MARPGASQLETWRRLARLPGPARATGLALLGSAALPAALALVAVASESPFARFLAAHPAAVLLVACCVAFAALLAFEPPSSASPLAYARQLRASLLELQSMYDADDRRRPGEGKEKEDDRVPSEP